MIIAGTLSVFASMIDFSISYAFTSSFCDGADPASDEGWPAIGFPDNPLFTKFIF